MEKYNFLKLIFWFEMQNYLLKSLISLLVIIIFSFQQTTTIFNSENLIQLEEPVVTQLQTNGGDPKSENLIRTCSVVTDLAK